MTNVKWPEIQTLLAFDIRHSSFVRLPMPLTESTLLPPDVMAQLERLELVTRKVFRGRMKGERRSKRKGQSVEFADFRQYVPGDDLRSLDWNLYARLDKLIIKLFLEEEDLHFFTLIDASLSMDFGQPTKLQYAKQLAAALGFVGLIRTDRVRIETLGQTFTTAARSSAVAAASGACSNTWTASKRAKPRRLPRA